MWQHDEDCHGGGNNSKKESPLMWRWTLAAHVALFCVWCFFVVFGNVMEAQQLASGIELVCDEDVSCPADLVYSEDGACCSEPAYENVYKILSVVGGTLAAAHLAYATHRAVDLAFQHVGGILFIFHAIANGTSLVVVFVGVAYVYQHLTYHVFFCHHLPASCDHPAREHWVIQNLFYSLLALSSPYLAIQLCRVALMAFVFAYDRQRKLAEVIEVERLLGVFSDDIDATFSKRVVSRYRTIRGFVRTWIAKSDDDVSDELRDKARRILSFFYADDHDTVVTNNGKVKERPPLTFSRFRDVLQEKAGSSFDASRIELMWLKLTGDVDVEKTTQLRRESSCLTFDGLQDVLYELFFSRKELIQSIHTDHYIITYLARVAAAVLYPAAFIAVARIFGYANAFGTGVDLFKTYMLAASFILTSFKDDLMFLLSMITDRPFNLGDVLLIDGQTYKVRRISLTHFYMDGPHFLSVPNSRFSSTATINLSKHDITDSLRISFPLTASDEEVNRDKMFAILEEYQRENPRDVSASSIRCGWADAPDGATKVMQCNWRYNFRVFDRSRLNWARADVRNHILRRLNPILRLAFVEYHVAGGGGLNDVWPPPSSSI